MGVYYAFSAFSICIDEYNSSKRGGVEGVMQIVHRIINE
jgi:hypothetical protein